MNIKSYGEHYTFKVCYYNLMDLIFILFRSIFYCIYSKSDHEIKREKDAW